MKLYLIAAIFLFPIRINAQFNTQDSLALVDLYNSTNGNAWAFNVNWLSKQPIHMWWGVDVDATGTRVIKVDLHDNNLTGSIPSSIGNLTALLALGLPNNNLSGPIPESIGNLQNLQTLKLWYNQLTGPIPSSIGNLKNLIFLLLNNNKINGQIPSSIGEMNSLLDLELFANELSDSIPSSIGNLPNLYWIKLYSNNLTGTIPQTIGSISTLRYLDLSNNKLSGIIPLALAQPAALDYFNVSNNKLTGSLPVSIMKHSKIGQIHMSGNQLNGIIPTEIGNAQNLVVLDLSNNQLTGNIPVTIRNLDQLKIVNLSNNLLTGPIPSGLGNLAQIYRLDISNNQLTDTLPSTFENLTGMRYLSIANNHLSGTIPTRIGFYVRGQIDSMFLHIENNRFTFTAIEPWAAMFKNYVGEFSYTPQAPVPIFLHDTIAFVAVGGTASKNTYNWYKDMAHVSSKLSDSSYLLPTYGYYTAQITNSVATELILSTDTLHYNGLPTATITYTGQTNLCGGDSIILYANSGSRLTYQWFRDTALISNSNISSYTVKTTGNYTVVVSNANGSVTSSSVSIKVLPTIPTPTIAANSSTTFCLGESVRLTSSAEMGNQWYQDGILVNNATSQNLIANTNGIYTVKVTLNGCSSPKSTGMSVTVKTFPAQPTITQIGTFLKSSSSIGNQWFLNGTAIAGANDSVYTPTLAGEYSTQVTINGCTSISAAFSYIVTSINSIDLESKIIISPNPVRDKLIIIFNDNWYKMDVSLFDINGREVFSQRSFIGKCEIDTKLFTKGIYIIKIVDTKTRGQLTKMLIKQ
jgi:Leucine-rich repeat (LRR) protein